MPEGYYQRLAGTTDGVDDTSSMSIEKGTSALFMCFRHHVFLQSPKVIVSPCMHADPYFNPEHDFTNVPPNLYYAWVDTYSAL